jgi:ABC-type Mn2+/Zn2+ transport system permease subunit
MVERLGDMWSLGFMQRAFIGGVLVGAACAFLSVFVVLRRLAFVSQGVSHAAFGGVALAVLVGVDPFYGAMAFSLGTAIAIGGVSRRRNWVEDSSIGIFLSVAMALGLLLLSFKKGSTANLFGYLFGSVLSILPGDLVWMVALAGGVFLFLLAFIKELYFYVFDETMARVSGIPVDFLYFGLLAVLAVTIVVGMKLVGVILVTALLVIPGAAARLLTTNIVSLFAASVGIGVASVAVGLTAAYLLDQSAGASIVLVLFACFLGALIAARGRR